MKRIYISLAFFILSIATGIFEMFYVTNRIDELNEEIVSADNLLKVRIMTVQKMCLQLRNQNGKRI